MIHLICVLTLFVHGVKVSKEVSGVLIEQHGDNWMVDFSSGMKRYKELKKETQVILVNGNACLIKEIK